MGPIPWGGGGVAGPGAYIYIYYTLCTSMYLEYIDVYVHIQYVLCTSMYPGNIDICIHIHSESGLSCESEPCLADNEGEKNLQMKVFHVHCVSLCPSLMEDTLKSSSNP